MANSTALYENVTSYVTQQYENGDFDAILQEVREECGMRCHDLVNALFDKLVFGERFVELITSMPTPAPMPAEFIPPLSP